MNKPIEQETNYGRLVYIDQVCFVYLNEDLVVSKEIIEDIHKVGLKLSGGKRHAMLTDLSLNVSSNNDTRVYASNNEYMINHIAYALVGKSIAVNLIANFFIKMNKPKIKTKLFSNEKEALKWLKKRIDKENSLLSLKNNNQLV